MTTPSSNEKRNPSGRISPRHVFETRIRIRLQRGGQKLTLEGWTRNLSEGGLNAFVAHALALGESVVLEIRLSNSGKQAVPAQVVRALGTEYGFQCGLSGMLFFPIWRKGKKRKIPTPSLSDDWAGLKAEKQEFQS